MPHALTTQSCALACTSGAWPQIQVAFATLQPIDSATEERHDSFSGVSSIFKGELGGWIGMRKSGNERGEGKGRI